MLRVSLQTIRLDYNPAIILIGGKAFSGFVEDVAHMENYLELFMTPSDWMSLRANEKNIFRLTVLGLSALSSERSLNLESWLKWNFCGLSMSSKSQSWFFIFLLFPSRLLTSRNSFWCCGNFFISICVNYSKNFPTFRAANGKFIRKFPIPRFPSRQANIERHEVDKSSFNAW